MKKTALFYTLVIFLTIWTPGIYAQVLTINNPNIQATLTADQVRAFGDASSKSTASPFTLDFEGIGNLDKVMQFYSGGTSGSGFAGKNFGVTFGGDAMAIIDSQHGGTGNFSTGALANSVLFFPSGSSVTISVNEGFSGMVSFDYTSAAAGFVSFYDDVDGNGNLLATIPFRAMTLGMKGKAGIYYDNWQRFNAPFPGTAKSVVFSGVADQCAFDDVTFGDVKNGKAKSGKADVTPSSSGGTSSGGFNSTPVSTGDPTGKGRYFIAGTSRLEMNIGGSKSKHDGEVDESSKYSRMTVNFLPKAGYFFFDNFVGGLFIDNEFSSSKSKSTGYKSRDLTFVIGPFVRYYIPVCDKLIPFAEAQVGFGVDNSKSLYPPATEWSKSNESVFSYRIGGGATYFFNNAIGADLFLGFLHDSYKYKDSGSGERSMNSSGSKSIYNEFTMQLGIVVLLSCH